LDWKLKWLVGEASQVLDELLRPAGKGGLSDEEMTGARGRALEKRARWAVQVLKVAKGRVSAVRTAAAKGGSGSAEDEPEDDSGVPADFLSHLK